MLSSKFKFICGRGGVGGGSMIRVWEGRGGGGSMIRVWEGRGGGQ